MVVRLIVAGHEIAETKQKIVVKLGLGFEIKLVFKSVFWIPFLKLLEFLVLELWQVCGPRIMHMLPTHNLFNPILLLLLHLLLLQKPLTRRNR